MVTPLLTGFVTGLSLIVAVGPQNVFLLRQGLRREHVGLVVAVCLASDALLYVAGTAGVGALVERAPVALEVLRWVGVAYLGFFAVKAFVSAANPRALPEERPARPRNRVVLSALALTYLNPGAYLDTIVMGGTLANQWGEDLRWMYTAGLLVSSAVWFVTIGFGAAKLAGPLSRPGVWRWIDVVIGVVMSLLVLRLALL
jgi:L-lysine exporter family protein LysE/ArgO